LNPHQLGPLIPAVIVSVIAGVLDWRFRKIPNWLTVSGAAVGILINTTLFRWPGLKSALLGMGLGLLLLLPFVMIRSLGAGDWKLAGALGACLGPHPLLTVLMGAILVAGLMALAVVVWTGRLKQTLVNIAHIGASLFSLRLPGGAVSLDNPHSTKIPFGVALALSALLYAVGSAFGKV
jgi:prepilin peptidase CpaA